MDWNYDYTPSGTGIAALRKTAEGTYEFIMAEDVAGDFAEDEKDVLTPWAVIRDTIDLKAEPDEFVEAVFKSHGYDSYGQYAADYKDPELMLAYDIAVERYYTGKEASVERFPDEQSAYRHMAQTTDGLNLSGLLVQDPGERPTLHEAATEARSASAALGQETRGSDAPCLDAAEKG